MKKILLPILITAVVIVMIVVILLIIRLQRKVSKTMEFIFRCRFCGKMLTDGSKCIDKKVNNAKIDASRVHKGIQLQEVTSNKDSNDKYTVFITKEANVEVQPNSTLQPNDSWFKNYYYEEVTCVCTVNSIYEEADKNKCRKIGWKYTKISTDYTEGILKADIVYGLLLDLVLDDTDYILCKTKGCHSKVAHGIHVTKRPASNGIETKEREFAKQPSVTFQSLRMPTTDGENVTVCTVSTANVSSSDEYQLEKSAFHGFRYCEVKCYLCRTHIGWKFKPQMEEPTRAPEFNALIEDKLFDSYAEFPSLHQNSIS